MWLPMHKRPSFLFRERRNEQRNPPAGSANDDLSSFFLSEPKAEHLELENKVFGNLEIGHACMQGLRVSMEDRHIIAQTRSLPDHILVAVFDGHAGTLTADQAAEHLLEVLEKTGPWTQYLSLSPSSRASTIGTDLLLKALAQAFVDLDALIKREVFEGQELVDLSGAAAVCALLSPSHIAVASVGDSRCVLGTSRRVVAMTDDHKPELPEERRRIEEAGGFVHWNRVNGQLAMSRALGDFQYKQSAELGESEQQVIAYPDLSLHARSGGEGDGEREEVLVVACDGVWDVVSNEESVSFVSSLLAVKKVGEEGEKKGGYSAQECAEQLIDWALERESTDNISALIVKFLPKEELVKGGKREREEEGESQHNQHSSHTNRNNINTSSHLNNSSQQNSNGHHEQQQQQQQKKKAKKQ